MHATLVVSSRERDARSDDEASRPLPDDSLSDRSGVGIASPEFDCRTCRLVCRRHDHISRVKRERYLNCPERQQHYEQQPEYGFDDRRAALVQHGREPQTALNAFCTMLCSFGPATDQIPITSAVDISKIKTQPGTSARSSCSRSFMHLSPPISRTGRTPSGSGLTRHGTKRSRLTRPGRSAIRSVVGADPNLIYPGQRLLLPDEGEAGKGGAK